MHLIELSNHVSSFSVFIRNGNQTEIIPLNEILYCVAEGNYTLIHLQNEQQLLTSIRISYILKILEPHGFLPIHKSTIVNLLHIRKIRSNGINKIIMINGEELEISRRCKQKINNYFTCDDRKT